MLNFINKLFNRPVVTAERKELVVGWTAEEFRTLINMWIDGRSKEDICKATNHSQNAVNAKLIKLVGTSKDFAKLGLN